MMAKRVDQMPVVLERFSLRMELALCVHLGKEHKTVERHVVQINAGMAKSPPSLAIVNTVGIINQPQRMVKVVNGSNVVKMSI